MLIFESLDSCDPPVLQNVAVLHNAVLGEFSWENACDDRFLVRPTSWPPNRTPDQPPDRPYHRPPDQPPHRPPYQPPPQLIYRPTFRLTSRPTSQSTFCFDLFSHVVTCFHPFSPFFIHFHWYLWYYPHTSRDSVPPLCIFLRRGFSLSPTHGSVLFQVNVLQLPGDLSRKYFLLSLHMFTRI